VTDDLGDLRSSVDEVAQDEGAEESSRSREEDSLRTRPRLWLRVARGEVLDEEYLVVCVLGVLDGGRSDAR
jgi:hypothetical protein